jgi:hypothetical protein
MNVEELALATRGAWQTLRRAPHAQRQQVLANLADALLASVDTIEAANRQDLDAGAGAGLDAAMLDRLRLDAPRITALAADVRSLIDLPDPLATRFDERVLANGLRLHRRHVPIGVLGVIYESRPMSPSMSPRSRSRAAMPRCCAAARRQMPATACCSASCSRPWPPGGLPSDCNQPDRFHRPRRTCWRCCKLDDLHRPDHPARRRRGCTLLPPRTAASR